MSAIVVADAGPLVALANIDHLQLLRGLYERSLAPASVLAECLVDLRLPGARTIERSLADGVIDRADDPAELDPTTSSLDPGERAAITLARTLHADVLIDELRGRGVARRLGVPVVGTVGVVVTATQRGTVPRLAPLLAELNERGYHLADQLVRAALEMVGE